LIKYSKILEDHQDNCEKSGKFVEAEMSKQRVAQLKKVEQEKLLSETKRTHEEQVEKKFNNLENIYGKRTKRRIRKIQ
jgi:hypothetical protein